MPGHTFVKTGEGMLPGISRVQTRAAVKLPIMLIADPYSQELSCSKLSVNSTEIEKPSVTG